MSPTAASPCSETSPATNGTSSDHRPPEQRSVSRAALGREPAAKQVDAVAGQLLQGNLSSGDSHHDCLRRAKHLWPTTVAPTDVGRLEAQAARSRPRRGEWIRTTENRKQPLWRDRPRPVEWPADVLMVDHHIGEGGVWHHPGDEASMR